MFIPYVLAFLIGTLRITLFFLFWGVLLMVVPYVLRLL